MALRSPARGTALVFMLSGACSEPAESPAAAPTPVPAAALDRAEVDGVILKLKQAIDERYSYRDRLGLDWAALLAQATPSLQASKTRDELVRGIAKELARAEDPHLALVVDGKHLATDTRQVQWNFALAQIKAKVGDLRSPGRCLSTGTIGPYAYALVNGLEKGKCDQLPADWDAAWPKLAAAPGLVVDLRGNQGGDEVKAQHIAGYFVDAPVAYVQSETRDAKAEGGFGPLQPRTLQPHTPGQKHTKPVVVLSGPLVMSSAESFVLMLRAAGVPIVGGRSRGASGNPQPIDLGLGITLLVPSWRARLVDGTLLEGTGVAPDVDVPVTAEQVAAGDPVLDAAIAELERRARG
jgi:hypothetical protein